MSRDLAPAIPIRAFEDLHARQLSGWIFRGVSNSAFHLKPKLERTCESLGVPLSRASELEEALLRAFRRRYHLYATHVPSRSDDVQWLALMQHHFAPTRFLDWTYSVYVATYFAVEHAEAGCATIWCLNLKWCVEECVKKLKAAGKNAEDVEYIEYQHTEGNKRAFRNLFMKEPTVDAVAPINPFHLSERLTIQKGIFLCAGSPNKPFEENLRAMPDWEQNVIQLILPRSLRLEALRTLYEMGMTRAVLFPGLDGFAESLGVYDPLFRALLPEPGWPGFLPPEGSRDQDE